MKKQEGLGAGGGGGHQKTLFGTENCVVPPATTPAITTSSKPLMYTKEKFV